MSRVDFYVLPEQGDQDRRQFACALVQKAWKAGNRICLLSVDRDQASELDDLLWTFRDISFVPHALADSEAITDVPVILSWADQPAESVDVLINLGDTMPSAADKFGRIAEIVGPDAEARLSARKRYRQYRDGGHELHNHDIETSDGG